MEPKKRSRGNASNWWETLEYAIVLLLAMAPFFALFKFYLYLKDYKVIADDAGGNIKTDEIETFRTRWFKEIIFDLNERKNLCFDDDISRNEIKQEQNLLEQEENMMKKEENEIKREENAIEREDGEEIVKDFKETPNEKVKKDDDMSRMVVYVSVFLLQVLLVLAIADIFNQKRAKAKANQKPLNRTCSLADITLMRHQRRESMRKDIAHGGHHQENADNRFPGRQIDLDNPLYRRCSFPVGESQNQRRESADALGVINRRVSLDPEVVRPVEHRRSHVRLIHRH